MYLPFRYRGYYYDADTGFYCLQSRYYDPETGRFLNADAVEYLGANTCANLFAYCGNNPVMCVDPSGCIVTSWDLAHLSEEHILELIDLTQQWEGPVSDSYRRTIRKRAANIRRKYLKSRHWIDSCGYVRDSNNEIVMTFMYQGNYIDYTLSREVMRVDISKITYRELPVHDLVSHMLGNYKSIFGCNFPLRSFHELVYEMDAHYLLQFVYDGATVIDLDNYLYEGNLRENNGPLFELMSWLQKGIGITFVEGFYR